MSGTDCIVRNCKITIFNKPAGITFHSCPSNKEMRNKWHNILKNRCSIINWSNSKICSKHFESKYFDSQRNLKDNAIPTLFPSWKPINVPEDHIKSKVDKVLSRFSETEIEADVESSLHSLEVTEDIDNYITDELTCKPNTPIEAEMWLLIKKQEYLNLKLKNELFENKKQVEILQNNLEEIKSTKKDMEQNIETYKYIVKCLQEKLATLEERVEILTSVESR